MTEDEWRDHIPSGYEDQTGYGQVSCSCGWDSGDKLGWEEHIDAALDAARADTAGIDAALEATEAFPPDTAQLAYGFAIRKGWAERGDAIRAALRDTPVADTAGIDADEEPWAEAAMWAYQFTGALSTAYDFEEADIVPLLDLLSALAESRIPSVEWPAVVPSIQAGTRGPFAAALRTPKPEGER